MTHIKVTSLCVLLLFASGVHLSGKTVRQAKPAAKQEDPHAKEREALNAVIKNVVPEIEKNCTSLKDAIISANAASSELPYDDNQINDDYFEQNCQSGTLSWTAERKFGQTDKDQRTYKLAVTVRKVHQLGNTRASPEGLVQLIAETPSITVDDGVEPTTKQVKWGLDLREEEYAQRFVLALQELSSNLKKKIDAERKLKALPSPPAPPPGGEKRKRRT